MATQTKSKRLDLRVRPEDDARIRAAANERKQTISDYLVESAIARIEIDATEHTHFVLDERQWNAFVADLEKPAEFNPRLAELFR